MQEVGRLDTVLQNSVAFGDLLFGVLGLLAAIGMWRRRPWTVTVTVAWAVSVVCTATVASFSFSDPTFQEPGTMIGTIATGLSTAIVTGLIVWAARVATRPSGAAAAPPV